MTENISGINTQCRLPERFYTKDDLNKMFGNKKIYI
jgi:hypothetical protein